MSSPEAKHHISAASHVIDAILVIGFFIFMFLLVRSHVPSNDPAMILLWGGLAAVCLSGVFWLALQMFRVVLRVQLQSRRK